MEGSYSGIYNILSNDVLKFREMISLNFKIVTQSVQVIQYSNGSERV